MALFEDAVEQLISTMQSASGPALESVVYHRGNDSVTLVKKVWTGRTPFRVMDRGNSRLIFSAKDFLIPCRDLVLNGVMITPQEGDWIEITFDNVQAKQRYEFMAPNDEPIWRYSDPQEKIYRIHSKRVKVNA